MQEKEKCAQNQQQSKHSAQRSAPFTSPRYICEWKHERKLLPSGLVHILYFRIKRDFALIDIKY